jgi:spore coat protein U-like protein
MKHLKTLLVGAGLLLASTGLASAATATGNLNVAVTISSFCSMNATAGSPLNLTFPTTGTLTQPVASAAATILNVTCSAGTPYTIKLGEGLNKLTDGDRQMVRAGGTLKIPYKLSRQALGVEEWGPGAAFTPTSPGSGAAQAFSIFGYIPAIGGTQPTPGTYTDTVVITIDY